MSERARLAFLIVVLLGCGDDAWPPDDAGVPDAVPPIDAGLPACFAPDELGRVPAAEECGVCLEPYAVIANPLDLSVGRDQYLAAVPGGLVALLGARVVFIGEDGTVIPYAERPEHVPRSFVAFELRAVPGARRAWVVVDEVGVDTGVDVVLLDIEGSGWRRVGSGTVDFLRKAAALDDGSLVGWDGGFGLTRARVGPDGSIETVQARGDRLFPGIEAAQFDMTYALPGARAAAVIRTQGPPRSSWLVVTDSDLNVVRPALEIGGPDQPGFPFAEPPFTVDGLQRTDGTVVLLQWGSIAGLNAWPSGHNWLLRIDPDGAPRDVLPGVWMNPTLYSMGEGAVWGTAGSPIVFPDGRDGLVWTLYDRLPDVQAGQVIDGSGAALFPTEHEFGEWTSLGFREIHDGNDEAYVADGYYRDPESPSADALDYVMAHWNSRFEQEWLRYVQECDERVGEYGFAFEGAYDDGVWVVWQDDLIEITGRRVRVPKVALLRSDGSWAWMR